jgi:hypothetical protein
MYRAIGFAHATIHRRLAGRRVGGEAGQGTIEYIGLILLIAGIMAVVVKAKNDNSIATMIVDKIKSSIDNVGEPPQR